MLHAINQSEWIGICHLNGVSGPGQVAVIMAFLPTNQFSAEEKDLKVHHCP